MVNPVVCTVGFSGYLLLSMIVGVLAGLYVQILDSGDVSGVRVNAALPCLLDESEPPPLACFCAHSLVFLCASSVQGEILSFLCHSWLAITNLHA